MEEVRLRFGDEYRNIFDAFRNGMKKAGIEVSNQDLIDADMLKGLIEEPERVIMIKDEGGEAILKVELTEDEIGLGELGEHVI